MVCISSLSPRSIESLVLDIRGLEQLASTASSPSKIFGLVDGNRSLERQVQQDVLKISRAQNASDLMARDVTHVGRAFSDKVSLSPPRACMPLGNVIPLHRAASPALP